jgi:hypothetical protein
MAVGENSILVGKSYRTADGEIRRVMELGIDGEVAFEAVEGPRGPGTIGRGAPRRLPLERFAREVEGEVGA